MTEIVQIPPIERFEPLTTEGGVASRRAMAFFQAVKLRLDQMSGGAVADCDPASIESIGTTLNDLLAELRAAGVIAK